MNGTDGLSVRRIEIDGSWLSKLSDDEQSLFLLAGHFANELNTLIKLFAWCSNHQPNGDLEQSAQRSQELLLGRIITGKLMEGWELLRVAYFGTSVSSSYDSQLDDDGHDALGKLKRYFGNLNLIRSVRKGHAFHYDFDAFKTAWSSASRDEKFVFYLEPNYVNSFYCASDIVAMKSLLDCIPAATPEEAMQKWIDETSAITGAFLEFISNLMFVAMKRMLPGDVDILTSPSIEIQNAAAMDSVRIPFFARVSHGVAAA